MFREPNILHTENGPRIIQECTPVVALVYIGTPEPEVDTWSTHDVDWWYDSIVTKMECAYAGFSLLSYYVLPHRELPCA